MLIDKPAGMTSHDVVIHTRRALGIRSVGHVGTLDPFATGLLILVIGRATRLARFLARYPKRYRAEAILGVRTESDDRMGAEISRAEPDRWPDRARVVEALEAFAGPIQQRPPRFSAKRIGGRRAYALARAGEQIDLDPVSVTVHRIALSRWEAPHLTFDVTVSTGTYVRSLARDIGDFLGLGAHLTELRRESIGPHDVSDATQLESVSRGMDLLDAGALVPDLPRVELDDDEARGVRHGRAVRREAPSGQAVLTVEGRMVAVAEGADGAWRPKVVLDPA